MRNRTEIVSAVLARAERQSADAALREVLREARISPEEKRAVSKSAFAYFRWRGWLDRSKSIRQQIELAAALGEQFEADPKSISDSELLANAVPEWVGEIMRITPELLREFQKEPRLWFRARPGTGKDLARALGSSAIHSLVADAIWYEGEEDLYRTKEFHAGAFEIQDLSSQIVGHLCDPAAGQTWWDACAGEGGKTLHLCDLMRNKGLVWASDPAMWRLDILKRRAARAGLFNYRI